MPGQPVEHAASWETHPLPQLIPALSIQGLQDKEHTSSFFSWNKSPLSGIQRMPVQVRHFTTPLPIDFFVQVDSLACSHSVYLSLLKTSHTCLLPVLPCPFLLRRIHSCSKDGWDVWARPNKAGSQVGWWGEEKKCLYSTLPQILLQDRKGDMTMEALAVSMVLLIGITINATHAQGKRIVAWLLFQWIPWEINEILFWNWRYKR